MRELHLEANGLRFRCLADGPEGGDLALLLHGFPEGAESWIEQLGPAGRGGYLAVAPDLRGYGGTDCPEGEDAYRMPHLIADVEGLVAALGRDRCHLAGHDWGALVGWATVTHRPELAITWSALSVGHPLALAEARADPDQRQRSRYIQLLLQAGRAEEVLLEGGGEGIRRFYRAGPPPVEVPDAQQAAFIAGFQRPGRLTAALNYYRANLSAEARNAFPAAAGPAAMPTQLVWGDQDPALGRLQAELTAKHVAGEYRLAVLEGAGHWLQFARPADITRLLLEWFDSHR